MLVGTFIAFDKHMNLVLADTEEFRRVKAKKPGEKEREIRRALGLVLLRGDNIVTMSAEAPPSQPARRVGDVGGAMGPGRAQAMGRAIQITPAGQAPAGLAGPGRGVGAPQMGSMIPPPPPPGMMPPPGGMPQGMMGGMVPPPPGMAPPPPPK
jgi:small nuclear ribonucleoprotein B and B'